MKLFTTLGIKLNKLRTKGMKVKIFFLEKSLRKNELIKLKLRVVRPFKGIYDTQIDLMNQNWVTEILSLGQCK